MMHILFTGENLETVLDEIQRIAEKREKVSALRIWHDEMDEAIKFKVNETIWSEPFVGETRE